MSRDYASRSHVVANRFSSASRIHSAFAIVNSVSFAVRSFAAIVAAPAIKRNRRSASRKIREREQRMVLSFSLYDTITLDDSVNEGHMGAIITISRNG